MKCVSCEAKMEYCKELPFNEHKIPGFKCKSCRETFFDPEQAQKVLLLNKLKKEQIHAKLGKIKSNLILRLPKDIEAALDLEKGEEVVLRIEDDELRVAKA